MKVTRATDTNNLDNPLLLQEDYSRNYSPIMEDDKDSDYHIRCHTANDNRGYTSVDSQHKLTKMRIHFTKGKHFNFCMISPYTLPPPLLFPSGGHVDGGFSSFM